MQRIGALVGLPPSQPPLPTKREAVHAQAGNLVRYSLPLLQKKSKIGHPCMHSLDGGGQVAQNAGMTCLIINLVT